MPYQMLDHTADIRMQVTGKTLEELFKDASHGMAEILHPTPSRRLSGLRGTSPPVGKKWRQYPVQTRTISIKASDTTNLLIDFLSEILSLANIHQEVYCSIEFDKFSQTALKAKLTGLRVPWFAEDIKAVTYHQAEVKKNDQGWWETKVVFDI